MDGNKLKTRLQDRLLKITYLLYVFLFFLLFGACKEKQNKSSFTVKDETAQALLNFESRKYVTVEGKWKKEINDHSWNPKETAIIICDMWNKHWCDSATARVKKMAPKVNELVKTARKMGVTIVHAPSSTMDFYQNHPARKKALQQARVEPPIPLEYWFYRDSVREPELPIDDSDEGCDSPGNIPTAVYSRQIETIEIFEDDLISDSGQEMHNYFTAHDIDNIVLCGVHTNMCVLGRTFGIRGQVKLGNNVVLARDLTDAMYNPEMPPKVSHGEGTELVINHIEKYWAPSVKWKDIVN